MSFHSTITSDELLPAEVRKALSLTNSQSVYSGRFPRQVSQPLEVFIERLPEGSPTFGRLAKRPYRLTVFIGQKTGGADQSGKAALDAADANLDAIVGHFDGVIPAEFKTRIDDLLCITAEEEDIDAQPENGATIGASAVVTFFVRS